MKVVGLLAVLFGGAGFYLMAVKGYRLPEFLQELANFTHIKIGQYQPGTAVNATPPPSFIPQG